ncbi:septal ring lytic transglycosylase RlpA family protein [Rickettsiella endosymbiont of Miltochrista miniata]|uniref:septal ring lytic transglycosylase RlpA family protein n=1 Tax=Rickettsiella endosymbiont of Miltochrista miniata TaxID=3066239 RepID=UPI00313EFFE7
MSIKNNAEQGSLFFRIIFGFTLCLLILSLGACSSSSSNYRYPLRHDKAPCFRINANRIPNAVPKAEPLSKRGNPKSYVIFGRRYYVMKSAKGYHARGIASWYGMKFHDFQTSNGEIYNVAGMTAAHKTLPLPTYLQVTNLRNGKKIIVKVNDRGPFVNNRLIDLSYAAAKKLDMTGTGTAPVSVVAITPGITRLASNNTSIRRESYDGYQPTKKQAPYIQLGLFKQRAPAQKLALLVKQWTRSPVNVKTTSIHKRYYYQVVIGPLPNSKSSQQLTHKLQLAGLSHRCAYKS